MKQIEKLIISFSLIFLLMLASPVCNSQIASAIDNINSQKIDSLIEIVRVSEHCILIKFGTDAITAINTKKGIVVIDAGISTGLTSRYRKIIENEFQRNDFIYIINTHGHPDHYGGNSVFSESGIIGHLNCPQEISEQTNNVDNMMKSLGKIVENYESQLNTSNPDSKEWAEIFTQKTKYLNAYNDAKNLIAVRQPDITFSDSLTINMGDFTLEMKYFGKCHSNSDILVYIPEMAILFSGDLFSKYGRPSINSKLIPDHPRWHQSVIWIEKRINNIEKIIDGHGQILSIDDLKSFNNRITFNSDPEK